MTATTPDSTVHPSVCPLDCADTCSLTITVDEGRVSTVRGSSANPFTRGKICAKVANGLAAQVQGQGRLTMPLRRNGPRGGGAYERISWPQALETIHERFSDIIADHGAQAIVPLSYGGPMGLLGGASMDKRFFHRLGATRVDSSTLCAGVSDVAYESLFGEAHGIAFDELSQSGLIVIWGNNITACNLHLTKMLREARAAGATLVVVDPRRTRIADDADLHLPLLPGTDVVLAYAVAAELERRSALDTQFLARHVTGVEAFMKEARQFSLARAATVCGLELQAVEQFANYWRERRPAAISMGVAPERNRNGGAGIRAAFALPVLTGNIGPVGAGICNVSGFYPVQWDALERPDLRPGQAREFSVLDVPRRILDTTVSPPVQALFIYNHNPVAVHPEQALMREALSREDLFIVGSDISMTDSMAYADIILPAASHLEYGDIYKSYGHQYLQRSEPVIAPVGESLPNTEIFRRLAAQFGFDEACFTDSDRDLQQQALAPNSVALEGRGADALGVQEALDMTPDNQPLLRFSSAVPTASGKIELFSAALEAECGEGVPHYREQSSDYPFILVSPASELRTNSTFGGLDEHDADLVAQLNPDDAQRMGLGPGVTVRLFNELGEVLLPLEVTSRVRPGTVFVPKGGWLKSSSNGQTINALVPGHRADIGGGACYNDARVGIVVT